MTDTKTDGGTAWELSEAIRLMGEAQASGDKAAIATAMRRHAEALSNVATEKVAKPFTRIVGGLLDEKISAIGRKFETALDQYEALRLDDYQFRHEFRIELSAFKQAQDDTLTELRTVSASLGKLQTDVDGLKARLSEAMARIEAIEGTLAGRPEQRREEHQAIIDEISGQIQGVVARIAADEAQYNRRLDTKRARLNEIDQEIRGLKQFLAMFVSPEEAAANADTAAAGMRELLAWVREERARRLASEHDGDGDG